MRMTLNLLRRFVLWLRTERSFIGIRLYIDDCRYWGLKEWLKDNFYLSKQKRGNYEILRRLENVK